MVTSVQLGNFFTSNGKTVLGGVGGSGLDTNSLITGLVAAKQAPETALKDQITANDKQSTALSSFQTLLSTLQDATNFLRNPPGVGNDASNVFKATTSSVTASDGSTGSNYVTLSTQAGATTQSYTINSVVSLATARQQKTGDISILTADSQAVFTTPGTGQFGAGTITINGQDITLNDGDSLNTVAAKFNSVQDTTGVSASVVQVSTGKYQVIFNGTKTGQANDYDLNAIGDTTVLTNLGLSAGTASSDSDFFLNGAEIKRATNNISDAISNITFNLQQATPNGTSLTATVSSDNTLIQNGVVNFANAYNAVRTFIAQQTQTNADGSYATTAVLANNQTFLTLANNITNQVNSSVPGLTGTTTAFADLGITFADIPATSTTPATTNAIQIDTTKLASAIAASPSAVSKIFGFTFNSDNPNLKVYARSNDLGVSNFTLTLNPYATQTTSSVSVADADTSVVSDDPGNTTLFKPGTISFGGHTVTIANGDTLNQIVQKFNDATNTTGVSAVLNQTGTGAYTISLNSTVSNGGTNFNLNNASVDPSGVFDNFVVSATGSYKASYTVGGVPTTVDVTAKALSSGVGYSITGQAGTALAGLVLIYASNNASVSHISTTQGIADKVYNTTSAAVKATTGSIAIATKALTDSDTKLNKDISKMEDQITAYRNQLLQQFSALEQAVSRVNTLLQSISANSQAATNAAAG